jgi:hypothetical protein
VRPEGLRQKISSSSSSSSSDIHRAKKQEKKLQPAIKVTFQKMTQTSQSALLVTAKMTSLARTL